jgi:hypothetical protein
MSDPRLGIPNTYETSALLASLVGAYNGESYSVNGSTGTWEDLSGHGNNGVTAWDIRYIQTKTMDKGKNRKYVCGTRTTKMVFPRAILPYPAYTMIHISKYNGASKGRIWTSGHTTGPTSISGDGTDNPVNWLSGHWGGRTGVAHHNGWITSNDKGFGENWVLSIDKPGMYSGNGNTERDGGVAIGNAQPIGINIWRNEESDWACALMLVFNRFLETNEINYIENWAKSEYGI